MATKTVYFNSNLNSDSGVSTSNTSVTFDTKVTITSLAFYGAGARGEAGKKIVEAITNTKVFRFSYKIGTSIITSYPTVSLTTNSSNNFYTWSNLDIKLEADTGIIFYMNTSDSDYGISGYGSGGYPYVVIEYNDSSSLGGLGNNGNNGNSTGGSLILTKTLPSSPTTFTATKTLVASGTEVTLSWEGAEFGDYEDDYFYELTINKTVINCDKENSKTITIKESTTCIIKCCSPSGSCKDEGTNLVITVPDNIGKATITGVGKSNSNPGFSPIGINDSILFSWEEPPTPDNNLVTSYSIYFNDNILIASEITNTTSYTLNNYKLTEESYKVTIRSYDSVGQYTDSKSCYLYTVNPSFNYGPRGETSVLLKESKINWGELNTGSLDSSLLNVKYTLKYLTTSTITVATTEETDNYSLIEENLVGTSYLWDTSNSGINDGDLVSLKIIGTVFKDNVEIISTEIKSDNEERLFKGKLPSKFNQIIFSIPEGQYYGVSSPMKVIYNVNETIDGGSWEVENTIYNFTDYLQIDCCFNKNNWKKSSEYIDAVQLKWKKGLYSGEVVNKNLNEKNKSFSIILSKDDNKELFSQSNEPINFEIYSLYETKKSNNSGSGIYIFSDSASLSFKEPTKFVRAKLPQVFNNGTSVPSLNSNIVRNVDFFKKEINSTVAVDGFWEKDYQLNDLRANSVVSDVPVVGFKIYATRDKENYKENGYVVNKSVYLKQTGGEVSFYDGEENKFFNFSLPLIKSGESATSATEGFVSFYPQILNDDKYLKQMFGNISSLQTLSTVETFYYVIAAIDALKQESIINYILPVTYDFRLAAEFQEGTTPVLISKDSESKPIFTSVTIKEKTGYLFHGQTDTSDWITFEWYPAFNKNDYLLNPGNYEKINGIFYLKAGDTIKDPNSYTLYKWINGKYRSKRLIAGTDFKVVTESKVVTDTVTGTTSEEEVKKYIGKYAMNLKDNKVSEYFNLTLMPSYIDSYKEEKMATPVETLNPIEEDGKTVYFHLSRFTPMEVSINPNNIERTEQTKFVVKLTAVDWGILTGEGIKEITSKMILRNSSIKADSGDTSKDILSNKQGSFELVVEPITYKVDPIEYDFKGHAPKIYDNMPFSSETIITITINRFSETNYTISKSKTSSITTTYNYYIPANFSTLSLRKNKVGINYSNLTNTEEALYVVAKDRIDSGNDIGNVAVYGNTYPHVFSIQGNLDTKMPSFSTETGKALSTLQEASIYMGFYTVNDESKPYRVGSFGIEEGQPYFVYKGKYYSDTTIGDNNCEKCYDNKDYFEKISIRNLPVPPGTMALYPRKNLEEKNDNGQLFLSQNKLKLINPTWYICDGNQTVILENNANLIKAIFPKEKKNENDKGEFWGDKNEFYEFTIPRRVPVGKISTEPIYAENGTTITGYIEKDISDEYCYIIKGDA